MAYYHNKIPEFHALVTSGFITRPVQSVYPTAFLAVRITPPVTVDRARHEARLLVRPLVVEPSLRNHGRTIAADVKIGENFRRKARFVADGYMTEMLSSITYSSVASRDSVRITLLVAALNGCEGMACDIQHAYLTAKCWEKVWTISRPEFGWIVAALEFITCQVNVCVFLS